MVTRNVASSRQRNPDLATRSFASGSPASYILILLNWARTTFEFLSLHGKANPVPEASSSPFHKER